MAKLFPPILEGTIPAFYSESGIVKITIPFSMNRAVSAAQVKGLALKIKTAQSSSYIYTIQTESNLNFDLENSPWAEFSIKDINNKLKVGQFYKFQLAYLDTTGEIGYYSTVTTGKYTTKPLLFINDLNKDLINSHEYEYTGYYKQTNGDKTERVYSYRFDIYNSNEKIIASSGDQLHNSQNDTELDESYDRFLFSQDLELNKPYRIKYTVTTTNGLTISSYRYRIMQKLTIDPEIKATLKVNSNYDNGYIDIKLIGDKNENGLEEPTTGAFLLTRACEDSNYTIWDEISRFKLASQLPSRQLWRDYTTEQGKNYIYSLQQYNDEGLYSNRMLSNIIYSDFEDAFLFDGKRQLKIKYNPKVSSFKANVLETKVDTIGSQHPFIFRNGEVYYREFPISGLISYYMDEENLFLSEEESMIGEKTTNLISENLAQERNFKMRVYEWLTNGKPKLFRSPSEGNFIVRLMNTSMTPTDQLGRMLHTFNTTAYEIAKYTYENLNEFDFIHLEDPEVPQLRWETVKLNDKNEEGKFLYLTNQLNRHPIYTVRLVDMIPGDQFEIITESNGRNISQIIQIGVTGSYYIDLGVPIKSIRLIVEEKDPVLREGSMTYSYYSIQSNVFDKIKDVTVTEIPVRQFIGYHDIIQEIEYVYDATKNKWLKNPKVDIIEFYNLYASKRSIEKVKIKDGVYYQDRNCKVALPQDKDLFTIYQVGDWTLKAQYNPSRSNYEFITSKYKDFFNNKEYLIAEYQPFISVNNSQVSVSDIQVFNMSRPGKLTELKSGNGTIIEVAYQVRNIDYRIEYNQANYPNLYNARLVYEAAVAEHQEQLNKLKNGILDEYNSEIEQANLNKIITTYNTYILELIKAQEEEKKAEGLI